MDAPSIVLEQLVDDTKDTRPYTYYDHPDFGPNRMRMVSDTRDAALINDFYTYGYAILDDVFPDDLISAYCFRFQSDNIPTYGWPDGSPFTRIPEIRDLCCYGPFNDKLKALFAGGRPALSLNLTGWVSTERNWHADCYLSPREVGSHYCAAWIALEDINPDSGPFEFVPGSHKMPFISQQKISQFALPGEMAHAGWPKTTERFVVPAIEYYIEQHNLKPLQFWAKRNQVLIWHSRLLHRGSPPVVPGTPRRALIAHYSVISHRYDMQRVKQHSDQGYYFDLPTP